VISIAYVLLAASTSVAPGIERVDFAQMMIRQRVVIRIPAMPQSPPPRPIEWREKKGPRCLPMSTLAGAAINQPDSVDLFVRGGGRYRAQLDDECPALDYYSGFYLSPTPDGQVCEGRDTIKTRAGGQCGIERFRTLVPRR